MYTGFRLRVAAIVGLLMLLLSGCTRTGVQSDSDNSLSPESMGHDSSIDLPDSLEESEYEFAIDEQSETLLPLDGESIPEEEAALYERFLNESTLSNGKYSPRSSLACSALPDYWRYAVYREACYALSRTKYLAGQWGQSTRTMAWGGGVWLIGDWNYCCGTGRGGECKEFARTLVKRATGNRYDLPTGYDYARGDISWCRPGDVIQRPAPYEHTAIVYKVLARDSYGRATRIDVIDANYVGGMGNHIIARHVFPWGSWAASYFRVW